MVSQMIQTVQDLAGKHFQNALNCRDVETECGINQSDILNL